MANASAVQSTSPDEVWAWIYLRITKDQEKAGWGVGRQLPACERECAALGWKIAGIVNENDTKASGKKPRKKYEAMLADLRAGNGNAVVGYAQDRVTRKTREAEDLLDLHDTIGTRIAIADAGELRLTNPDTRANFRNSTVNGMREIDWISKRTRDESHQRAHRGLGNGPVPFGYRRNVLAVNYAGRVTESEDVLDPAESAVLKLAAKRLLQGISMRQVTAEIEAGSVRPRRAPHWTSTLLRQYLLREGNAGKQVHRGAVLTDVTPLRPVIFDAVTFGRLKQLLTDPGRLTNTGSAHAWLLSGIATCGREGCNGKIRVQNNKQQRHAYSCRTCLQRHWVADIDPYISVLVQKQLADPAAADIGPDVNAELEQLYAQLDAVELEKTQAAELVGNGITLSQLVTLNAGYNTRLAELNADITELLPSAAASVELPDGWEGASLAEKRAALRALFSVIELQPAELGKGGYRVPFHPDHVRVVSA